MEKIDKINLNGIDYQLSDSEALKKIEDIESSLGGGVYTKEESDDRYVLQENGKGLSTYDFTNIYKTSIDGIRKVNSLSHLNDEDCFTSDANDVNLNFDCINTTSVITPTIHSVPIPVASETSAGIITSDTYKMLKNMKDEIKAELAPLFEDIYRIIGYEEFNGLIVVNSNDKFHCYYNGTLVDTIVTPNEPTKIKLKKGCTSLNLLATYTGYIISLDFSNLDTSMVTNMRSMLEQCVGLKSLNLMNVNTSNVTDMSMMFSGCRGLTSLDLSSFDTSKVTTFGSMFNGCSGLTSLDLSSFDTSKVTTFGSMFNGCSGLTSLDLSSFYVSNTASIGGMFSGCSNLEYLDISNFEPNSNFNMFNSFDTFNSCDKLTHIKCKRAFRDWCWGEYQNRNLPEAMKYGGSGKWEIIN